MSQSRLSTLSFGLLRTERRERRGALAAEVRAMLVDLANDFAGPGTTLYQLGLAGNDMLPALHAKLDRTVRFAVSEASPEHLDLDDRHIDFLSADLNHGVTLRNASVALMVSTSRLVHPLQRLPLIEDVHRGLRAGGCALVIEHVRGRESLFNNLFALHARERERVAPGYDVRQSNDDLLMASSMNEECELLALGGFRSVDVFYKSYGLCGLIAIK